MEQSKKVKKIVLTPDHNYWRALGIRLNDLLGNSNNGCYGDLRFTKKILKSFPGIDFDETLNLFHEIGGLCDCHVLKDVVGYEILKTAVPGGYK